MNNNPSYTSDDQEKKTEDMNQNNEEKNEEKNEPKPEESSSAVKDDGSYEIIFGTGSKDSTSYSATGFNAYGFSANGSTTARSTPTESSASNRTVKKAKEKSKNTFATALLAISVVLFAASIIMTGVAFAMMQKDEPTHSLGSRPTENDTLEPWINPEAIPTADAYSSATAKTVDSVVVINCTASAGSGVIWASNDSFSYILTCHHVIDGEKEIKITFYNNESTYAEVVGSDARTDIAILRVDVANLPAVVLPSEESTLSLGQAVIAIGNPLGSLGNSVSNGILSSLSRTVSIEGTTMQLIQTNAAVNHGNSGGGLFDLNGQLIGLVNAKVTENTVEGIGFAIPYTTLKSVATELIEQGFVSGRPRLGISTVTLSSSNYRAVFEQYPDLESYAIGRSYFGNQYIAGVYVIDASDVAGYAENSDTLQFGDRLTAIGGDAITSSDDIVTALNHCNAGETIQLTVTRNNKSVVIELILGEIGK